MDKYNILRIAMLSTMLLAPATGSAYSLGEIAVQSYLGQPLRAAIPVLARREEEIDPDCLKLSPPPADADMVYLRRATLSVTRHGDSSQLLISGHFPLDEPYLNVAIDIGCKDQGHLVREYTVLIDPPSYTSLPSPSATSLPSGGIASPGSKAGDGARSETSNTSKPARAARKAGMPAPANPKPVKAAKQRQDQLKVLAGTGEKPVQPGLSETERLQQREKDLMKELDDKTAKHLEMEAQLVKLESKLVEMQKTLERQNQLLATMQQAPAPAKKAAPSWNNDYWLAGSFVLVGGLGYVLARRSRKQAMDNWTPAMRKPE